MSDDLILPLVAVAFSLVAAAGVKIAAIRQGKDGKGRNLSSRKQGVQPPFYQAPRNARPQNNLDQLEVRQQKSLYRPDLRHAPASPLANVMNKDPARLHH